MNVEKEPFAQGGRIKITMSGKPAMSGPEHFSPEPTDVPRGTGWRPVLVPGAIGSYDGRSSQMLREIRGARRIHRSGAENQHT